jgi:hypothetical protein
MSVHLRDKVTELLKKFRGREGFNGVHCETQLSKSNADWAKECEDEEWTDDADYVCFIVIPIFRQADNDYERASESRFVRDLKKFLIQELGEGLTIGYSSHCREWEIYREKPKESEMPHGTTELG